MSDAFKGDWGKRFPSYAAAAERVLGKIRKTPVKVLVWGPRLNSDSFDKRQRIIDHLSNGVDEVLTSEDIIEAIPEQKDLHPYDAEWTHVQMCDVLFVLIVKDRAVTGSQTEVAIFRNRPEFRQKVYLIVPEQPVSERPRGFLSQGWVSYDDARLFKYTDEQFTECTRIRAYCAEIVEQVRRTLCFSY